MKTFASLTALAICAALTVGCESDGPATAPATQASADGINEVIAVSIDDVAQTQPGTAPASQPAGAYKSCAEGACGCDK
ncbi:MAG: hypothetical protein AAF288_07005 [Planctomycetota bacterium]